MIYELVAWIDIVVHIHVVVGNMMWVIFGECYLFVNFGFDLFVVKNLDFPK